MTKHVAHNRKKLLLLAAGWMVVALPWVIGDLTVPVSRAQSPTAAQSPTTTAAKLEFDVVSVKQNKSDDTTTLNFDPGPGDNYSPTGGYLSATKLPLFFLIQFAYKMTMSQTLAIVMPQLPDWARSSQFDIQARAAGEPTKDQMRQMVRSMLVDRFKLMVHTETREVPVYALMLVKPGKTGPQLKLHSADIPCSTTPPATAAGAKPAPSPTIAGGFGLPVVCGGIVWVPSSTPGRNARGARNVSIGVIANEMSIMGNLGRPVIDQTGLSGNFDFTFEWAPEAGEPLPPGSIPLDDVTGPRFLQALIQQLGLKLVSTKAPQDFMVVDHIEQPSPN